MSNEKTPNNTEQYNSSYSIDGQLSKSTQSLISPQGSVTYNHHQNYVNPTGLVNNQHPDLSTYSTPYPHANSLPGLINYILKNPSSPQVNIILYLINHLITSASTNPNQNHIIPYCGQHLIIVEL